jgi:caa(3)-type oxidase subunit IV
MSNDHAHVTSNKQYFTTWCWLLLMTMFALAIGYVPMPEALKAVLLVGTTLAKILLIGSIFMHLKFEKMNLVMLTFSPMLLAMILFFMTRGETRMHDETHQVITHLGEKIPTEAEGAAAAEGGHEK